jgi:hypothetical protein
MDCKDYQDLLIQLPYNELDQQKTTLLKKHLESCERCAAEHESNQQLYEFTKKLSASVPVDEDRQTSIDTILDEIGHSKEIRDRKIISYRALKVVMNTAAVFLIGLFLFQQVEMKRNLENLNARIENQPQNNFQNNLPVSIKQFTQLDDNQIERLLSEYDKLLKENKAIIEYLKLNYPEVYKKLNELKNLHEL